MLLSELKQLELWGTDISNAYLEDNTKEKLFIIAGPEFDDLEGHILVMDKALYGTTRAEACWHDHLFDVLKKMGFNPSKGDPDVWMRPPEDNSCYEYIAVFVDDLAISAKDPKKVTDDLQSKHYFKLKGTEPLTHHLGCIYVRYPDGTLVVDPTKYVDKIVEAYGCTLVPSPKRPGHHLKSHTIQI